MKFKKLLFACLILTVNISCSHHIWTITQASSTRIVIDSTTEAIADKKYEAYLLPTKQKIDAEMNVVIGQAAESMRAKKPESLLSNFSADVYRQAATDYLKANVDISVVNLGGLRTEVPAGNITVRKVFELMPFENELVILWLKGDKLKDLLNGFAAIGGQGVSGLHMKISNGKAENVTINGKPLDINHLYTIATNDYLAAGNDNMLPLAMNEKRVNTGLKIRNVLMDYIKSETKKGNKIQSKLDGRIQ